MSLGTGSLGTRVLAGLLPGNSTGLKLFINGVDQAAHLAVGSLSITDNLGQRSTCEFKLIDDSNTYDPATGSVVIVVLNGVREFKGTIDNKTRSIDADDQVRRLAIRCVDRKQVTDRFFVAKTYETADQTADDLVRDILQSYLAADGIVEGVIETGPLIVKAVYNYVKVSDALNELAERTGYIWDIDAEDRLNFRQRSSYLAPFNFSDASRPYRAMKHVETRSYYRNRQYLIGGQALTDSRTERFAGDGERKTFTMAFPIGKAPTSITVNGTPKTVGVRAVDSGKDFYWSSGSNELSQDDGATALVSSDDLLVTYQGFINIVGVAERTDLFAERANAEGGTGIYEAIDKDNSVDDVDLAQEKISGLLRRYAQIMPEVSYETDLPGLRTCMIQTINVTKEGVNDEYLLTQVRRVYHSDWDTEGVMRTTVKATSGEYVGGWAEFLKKLFALSKGFSIRESDVLQAVRAPVDSINLADTLNTTDPLDDGSGDPYSPLLTCEAADDDNLEYGVELGVIG